LHRQWCRPDIRDR